MSGSSLVTSVTHTEAKATAGKQKPYWIEFQLVDEQGDTVENMSWTVASTHPGFRTGGGIHLFWSERC